MEVKTIQCPLWHTSVQISTYIPARGVTEYMAMIVPEPGIGDFAEQLDHLHSTVGYLLAEKWEGKALPLLKRYFVSDAANQEMILRICPEAISVVQQPPLNGSKVCLWMWLRTEAELPVCRHNGYSHYFTAGMSEVEGDSERQTHVLLRRYEKMLNQWGGNLADQCIRTWFFVRDVDVNYAGVVKGRKEEFVRLGLTEQTHYLTSTGIQGQNADPRCSVLLDAYAVDGLEKGQIRFLYAPEYLNPTYEYGVTFERGTAVEYGDRKHIFISGTASIDNQGKIVCPGDITGQMRRMLLNIGALLREAGSSLADMAHMIVYLRDIADYTVVKTLLEEQFPDVPKVIVLAPVCRPGWLIETECIAIKAGGNPKFRDL
ncbi:Rid family hydrolase [uncultured Culturomica sp.]|jgi:enamine deaminase RidA (YjgF/YER057c/UK114 family)|uniref:Rid family hydrolase n=1 Tax=uncultured Culturomica sp. TaxID=1926654 RepID=UPI00033EA90C|nr:Rid family hydrolase [uncultured Culturomica sp.]CCZ07636.1 uncharacterized protein BN783_02893 [Odoribacter sp. CAG:788]